MTVPKLFKPVLFSLIFVLCLSFLLKCFNYVAHYVLNQKTKETVTAIHAEFKGVITNKYKNGHEPNMRFQISTLENRFIDVAVTYSLSKNTSIGDTIIKNKDDNYVVIKQKTGDSLQTFYTPIYFDVRHHKLFPNPWRKKWLKATPKQKKIIAP